MMQFIGIVNSVMEEAPAVAATSAAAKADAEAKRTGHSLDNKPWLIDLKVLYSNWPQRYLQF